VGSWLVPRSALTPDQLRAVEAPGDGNRVVAGPSCSGKSVVLLHRARTLLDRAGLHPLEGYSPEGFRVLAFTNTVRDYLRAAAPLLRIPADCIVTFDHWCRLFHEREIGPFPVRARVPDFSAIRQAVRRRVLADPSRHRQLLCALVDEGQDLPGEAYAILGVVARHVTVCVDADQQIFSRGSTDEELRRLLGVSPESVSSLEAARTSPLIARLAGRLLPADEGRVPARVRPLPGPVETPLVLRAASRAEEGARVASLAKERRERGERVAILVPRRDQLPAMEGALATGGLDPGEEGPMVFTYHAAKGLSFDSVFLPRLVPSSFRGYGDEGAHRLLHVGVTRATRWVCLSTVSGEELPLLQDLCRASGPADLTVQDALAPRRLEKAPPAQEPSNPLTDWL